MILNQIKTTILIASLVGLFIAIGYLIGSTTGMIIAFAIAMLFNFGMYWFSDRIVLKMYKAKEVKKGHRLHEMVKELAAKAKLPMPKVYIILADSPNAFATGRSPKHASVAATESLLTLLTDSEIRAVMAHELSHIKHRDTLIQTLAVGIAAAVGIVAEMLQWTLIFGFGGDDDGGFGGLLGALLIIILTPIIATIIQLAISRQREYMADAGASRIMGTQEPLISALEKLEASARGHPMHSATRVPTESLFIVNPFRGSGLASLFSTHPSTENRVARMKQLKLD